MRVGLTVFVRHRLLVRILTPELLERRHQSSHVETIVPHPRCFGNDALHAFLRTMGKIPTDDFRIHRIGRHERPVHVLQDAQVQHIAHVVLGVVEDRIFAHHHRFDDAPDARLLHPLHQRIDVRAALAHDFLIRLLHVRPRDGLREILLMNLLHTPARKGVDEIRLALRERERLLERLTSKTCPVSSVCWR